MVIQDLAELVGGPLQRVWSGALDVLGTIIVAAVVLIVGLIVANALSKVVQELINRIKLDNVLASAGLKQFLDRAGLALNSGKFLGQLIYWFLAVVFILAASDVLGFVELSNFLRAVVAYVPNVIVSVLIMLAAVVIANFLQRLVQASVRSAKLHAASFLSSLTWWSVVIFGFFTALSQLGIGVAIINSLVTGFVAMLALAGGIAFGMGGKDYAAHLISKLREKTEH
ncbi:hypothetical protein HY967_01215 [Candidatus Jorgensenbacteria bacterium]|nr:hypothetical protein [Candidatus Jorgensenbacteria bacterium]